ncbi:PREDICTED: uncharacterized protein LOC107170465 [Diuraphis noxia]|uniref:uncharacterized protein LOC107170465 n=1 Tax=Diuraphis noxia TaxID=143948 RepID=UPI000763612C|nr:PREDICTED: uncharacterized protein LOC107170465 [Diuraphis noxia]
MVPPNSDILQSFNLWLGNHKTVDGGKCGDKNMDHFMFDCMAKHPFFTDEDTLEGWYVMLYDRMARWSGRQDYRCALYETVKEDPPLINMVISANQSCHGLLKRIEQPEHTVPKGLRHFSDGSVALQFNKDLPQKRVRRKIQSEVESGGYRKKRELVIEEDRIKKGINNRKKRCYYPNQRDELKRIERGESIYVNKIGQKYPDSLNKTATTPSKVVQ